MSGVFQNIDPPPSPPGECVQTPLARPPLVWGKDTLAGWGVNSSEDARHCSVIYIRKCQVVFLLASCIANVLESVGVTDPAVKDMEKKTGETYIKMSSLNI
jgi:hypothetical protein